MVTKLKHSIRKANIRDQQQLANLIHFETLVHRHLDWRPPLEWIGYDPYLVLEEDSAWRIGRSFGSIVSRFAMRN